MWCKLFYLFWDIFGKRKEFVGFDLLIGVGFLDGIMSGFCCMVVCRKECEIGCVGF